MYQDNLIITLNSKNATLMNSTLKSSVNFILNSRVCFTFFDLIKKITFKLFLSSP